MDMATSLNHPCPPISSMQFLHGVYAEDSQT
jgi:hypothetical protein